jgi:hypothetical protein
VTRPPRASNAVSGVPRQSFSPLTPIIFFNEDDLPAKLVYDANNYATLFQQGEEKGFAWFFKNLYPALTYYCFKITGDK